MLVILDPLWRVDHFRAPFTMRCPLAAIESGDDLRRLAAVVIRVAATYVILQSLIGVAGVLYAFGNSPGAKDTVSAMLSVSALGICAGILAFAFSVRVGKFITRGL